MSEQHTKPELTPKIIMDVFKMIGLDNPQTREHLEVLSERPEKALNGKYEIITTDNTSEQKEGTENA